VDSEEDESEEEEEEEEETNIEELDTDEMQRGKFALSDNLMGIYFELLVCIANDSKRGKIK